MQKNSIAVLGNCQVGPISDALGLMLPHFRVRTLTWAQARNDGAQIGKVLQASHHVFCHTPFVGTVQKAAELVGWEGKIHQIAPVFFSAYQPDGVNATSGDLKVADLSGLTSGLALAAYLRKVPQAVAKKLFTPENFTELGYLDRWEKSRELLIASSLGTAIPLDRLVDEWASRGPFMHVMHHPKLFVLSDMARAMAKLIGEKPELPSAEGYVPDTLQESITWPLYPGIAERYGVEGSFVFRARNRGKKVILNLEQMIASCYETYEEAGKLESVQSPLFEDEQFSAAIEGVISRVTAASKKKRSSRANPYRGLPAHRYWAGAVAGPARSEVDPVVAPLFGIRKVTKVATAGSCFAQHIARALHNSGFNYFVAENGPEGMTPQEREEKQFGLFSARFGNIYSVRQLWQLFQRAFGNFQPVDRAWALPGGGYADPFRPTVEPNGFRSAAAVESERRAHMAAVRVMFRKLDVFVFTLGLTEAWESKQDGAVFPAAPGVISEAVNPDDYRFVNFTAEEVAADLQLFIDALRAINPKARIILTVSPVPLIATYENQHVLVSTAYSKAALRVAAETAKRSNEDVAYFPSYEIVTGNHTRGGYFEEDLRSVRREAVDHVMRLFLKHYGGHTAPPVEVGAATVSEPQTETAAAKIAPKTTLSAKEIAVYQRSMAIVCDEELLVQ